MWLNAVLVLLVCSCVSATEVHEALLWGPDELQLVKDVKNENDLKLLKKLINDIDSIVVFNEGGWGDDVGYSGTVLKLSGDIYQRVLNYTELYYAGKIKLETLTGPLETIDAEISQKFQKHASQYDKGRVLGVFEIMEPPRTHRKRRAIPDYYFVDPGNVIIKTTRDPDLIIPIGWQEGNIYNQKTQRYDINKPGMVMPATPDDGPGLTVKYDLAPLFTVFFTFNFDKNTTHWWMADMVLSSSRDNVLETLRLQGYRPTALLGKAYKCSNALVFRGHFTTFKFWDITVQSFLNRREDFGPISHRCPVKESKTNWGMIAGIIAGVVLLVAIGCFICKWCRWC